jgi:hypothetical protein
MGNKNSNYRKETFYDTQALRYMEPDELKALLERYCNMMNEDPADEKENWEYQISWILRESQCRTASEKRETLYDLVFYPLFCSMVYKKAA